MILEKIVTFRGDFTASSLQHSLAEADFYVTPATIYNNLKLFESAGIIRRRLVDTNVDTYEYSTHPENHISLVCSRCGRIREAKDVELMKLLNHIRFSTFVMSSFDLYIHGLCAKCRSGGRLKR